ncbi:hypothetical protein Poli38472_006660 [Pythium oligandrum]|uniref:BRCT domain-containing protein n=1 Tax=Pythium oligandrum TaxID=41045 RepID=A0A8K1C570_PYTOL|nr:hypothetical protein Poli38472_006660 [Pythium oligandrum]|eukprot:TMW56650.1 hypothetical protein Poli38472_006660 [Pythium oligandrum]
MATENAATERYEQPEAVQFVTVFHGNEGDEGAATPMGFQDTPDQWYTANYRKRGVSANGAATRDSQATQSMPSVTQVQATMTQSFQTGSGQAPMFVKFDPAMSQDLSQRRYEEDEDETQIVMSLSQDPSVLRLDARRIEEEELDPVVAASKTSSGNQSDAESDLSDDMLEQDGSINGLSSIAASFQQSEAQESQVKTPVHTYKSLRPTQPSTMSLSATEESSGAETEVEEEPETPRRTTNLPREERSVAGLSSPGGRPAKRYTLDQPAATEGANDSPGRKRTQSDSLLSPDTRKTRKSRRSLVPEVADEATEQQDQTYQSEHNSEYTEEETTNTDTSAQKGKRAKTATPKRVRETKDKRASSQASTLEEPVIPQPSPTSVNSIRIMFTGLDATNAKLRDKVKRIADASQEDDEIETVTHLIAPRNQLKRTVKLLCGISLCDHILDERWLDESARSGVPANEATHCLKDTSAESKWDFSLYHTMYEVPKDQRRQLFRGLRFYITNHKTVLPPVKDLAKIVECAGGVVAEAKPGAKEGDIVITTEAAAATATVRKAIASASSDQICTPELILSGILQQRVDLEAHRLQLPEQTPAKKRSRR